LDDNQPGVVPGKEPVKQQELNTGNSQVIIELSRAEVKMYQKTSLDTSGCQRSMQLIPVNLQYVIPISVT